MTAGEESHSAAGVEVDCDIFERCEGKRAHTQGKGNKEASIISPSEAPGPFGNHFGK